MNRRNKTRVIIILAYRVCITTIRNAGSNTYFYQQLDRLEERREKQIDIRSKMIDDLIVLINKIQTDNHDVILTIDANEQFESGKGGVAKLISMTKLVDPIVCTHGLQNMPNIYQRGSKKNRFHFYLSKNIQVYTSLRYHYIQSSIPIRPPRYVHRRRLETFITKQIPKQYRTIKQVVTIKRYQTSNKIQTNSPGVCKTTRHYSIVRQNKQNH